MLPEIPREELSDTLDAVPAEVLEAAGVDGPPVDAVAVARKLGIHVAVDDRQRGRARYVRLQRKGNLPPQPTILLRPEPRPERRQWAVAHEIGEHAAYQVFDKLLVDPREAGPGAREAVANQMAGRILLPGPWFADDGAARAWDLLKLKARYPTASHELIARRMLELPPPVIVTIFDHGQVSFRQSNVMGQVPPLSVAETECYVAAHRDNRPHDAEVGPLRVCAWPVHEPGWKREILRAELDAVLMAP